MTLKRMLAASAATVAMSCMPISIAHAQQTTSEIRGVVTDPSGAPVAGASVTIIDTRNGQSRRVVTGRNGEFSVRNLVVGGPYSVAVDTDDYRDETIENVRASLGAASEVTIALDPLGAVTDEIVVNASRATVSEVAIGPNSAFDLTDIENFPSIQRDIRDIIRFDPRVSIDLANEVPRVSCLGGNDRSNTFTVDGVVRADVFGLNGTPFASRNTLVIPFDAIAQTTVEFAPFDVEYGQFTGCNINVVTKSGSNEFHGSAFFNYSGSGLQGDSLEGRPFTVASYDDYNWGGSVGGPIIKDKLFFFAAYEETDDGDIQEDGPLGAGFPNEGAENEPTLALVEQVQQILESAYGIETGGVARTLGQSSRRILGRLDWFIADGHRLEFTYDRLREQNIESDDYGFEPVGFTFLNSFENEGTKSETYSARLFSDWTENFSTELRISRADVSDVQGPVGGGEAQSGAPIPRFIIGTGGQTAVTAGPGQFRSANELNTQVDQLKAKANYQAGAHTFTLGYELNQLDVFNLFIVNATGTLIFNSIADLQAGTLSPGFDDSPTYTQVNDGSAAGAFGNFSFTGAPEDAAASFSRSIHSVYAQDEWQPNDDLNVLVGVRYDWYRGADAPLENQNFINRYGFSNARDFGDLKALLPRVGITWNAPWTAAGDLQFRLGAGVFTGGDPTVWFSNAFSNSGNLNGFGSIAGAGCTPADFQVLNGGAFTGVPQCVIDAGSAQAATALADTQSTDPNLELASIIRSNFGLTWDTNFSGGEGFFDGWRVDLDYVHSQFRDPYTFVDLAQTIDTSLGLGGVTIDGRPFYRAIDPTAPGCSAQLVGTGGNNPQYANVTGACFATGGVPIGRDDEIQLTNADGYFSQTASAIFSKTFDYSILNGRDGSARVAFGYAWTDSNNRRDLTSAQSTSNFDANSQFDRQNPSVATSGFETRHNLTFRVNLRQEFVKDYETSFGAFFSAASGRPYSYTFDGGGVFNDFASGFDNASLYVPTGVADPFLSPSSDAAAVAALDAFIEGDKCLRKYRGRTAPRNSCRNDWFLDLDLRLQQELPVLGNRWNDRLVLFADVDNFLNLITDEANIRRLVNTEVDLVDVAVDPQGRYVISGFAPDFGRRIDTAASVWSLQLGIRYEF